MTCGHPSRFGIVVDFCNAIALCVTAMAVQLSRFRRGIIAPRFSPAPLRPSPAARRRGALASRAALRGCAPARSHRSAAPPARAVSRRGSWMPARPAAGETGGDSNFFIKLKHVNSDKLQKITPAPLKGRIQGFGHCVEWSGTGHGEHRRSSRPGAWTNKGMDALQQSNGGKNQCRSSSTTT